jgi:FkbM family methyltransferase
MSLKSFIRKIVRMLARPFVGTVHDRLNVVDRQFELVHAHLNNLTDQIAARPEPEEFRALGARLAELGERTDHLAAAEGALLQGSIRAIELLQELQVSYQHQSAKADSLRQKQLEWEPRIANLQTVSQKIQTEVAQVLEQDAASRESSAESSRKLLDSVTGLEGYTKSILENEIVRQVCLEIDDYEFTNPETGLMAFLYSYLPTRKALDIGANAGDVSERLLRAGYEVYAFEPLPDMYEKLVHKLGAHSGFHAFQFAVGSNEVEMPLHTAVDTSDRKLYGDASLFASLTAHSMPDDLPFTSTVLVKVNTLKNLHQSGLVPEDISLVKIDTEGFDLEVIRGMGDYRYPVVGAEFWDRQIPFGRSGLLYTLESLVGEMRSLGYSWHVVLYRIWGQNHTAYYGNHARSVPHSWGNVVFFRDYQLFAQAQAWCGAVLPRTYFKPMPAS